MKKSFHFKSYKFRELCAVPEHLEGCSNRNLSKVTPPPVSTYMGIIKNQAVRSSAFLSHTDSQILWSRNWSFWKTSSSRENQETVTFSSVAVLIKKDGSALVLWGLPLPPPFLHTV